MNPRAKKKARAISQGIGSPKAEKAAAKVSVLVRTEAPRPMRATAPSGSGCVMIPTIVARKMASSCHAFLDTPEGTGTNQRITPVAIEAISGFIAAPVHGCGGDAGATGEEEAEAEALTVSCLNLKDLVDFANSGFLRERLVDFVKEFKFVEANRVDVDGEDPGDSLRERNLRE